MSVQIFTESMLMNTLVRITDERKVTQRNRHLIQIGIGRIRRGIWPTHKPVFSSYATTEGPAFYYSQGKNSLFLSSTVYFLLTFV